MAQQILVLCVQSLPESITPGGGLPRTVRSGIPFQSRSDLVHVRSTLLLRFSLSFVCGFLLDFRQTIVIQMSVAERGVALRAHSTG